MEFRSKKIFIASGVVLILVLFVSIAFSALASNLNVRFGRVTQNAVTWKVGFKDESVMPTSNGTSTEGISCGSAIVTPSTVTISDSMLSKPGDKCTYPLTIQNTGDIAAKLTSIAATAPTSTSCEINGSTMVCGNITYMLQTYSGSILTTDVTINKNEYYNIQLIVLYSGDNVVETSVAQSNAKFTLTYTQASNRTENAPDGVTKAPKCKRATTLHTEECGITTEAWKAGGCYNAGYSASGSKGTTTITYGSLGTDGTLNAGDAFDCDVNGDGTYDVETERFYYISGKDGDNTSEYVTLLYYSNVSGGVAVNSNAGFKYGSNNYLGPTIAYQQLPTTTQWSNVSLSNQTRQMYNEKNETTNYWADNTYNLREFTYTNRAARLLTINEVVASCDVIVGSYEYGQLDNCIFLLEHSLFANSSNGQPYWTETARSTQSAMMWEIFGDERTIGSYWRANSTANTFGVRPVIEVLKSDISY